MRTKNFKLQTSAQNFLFKKYEMYEIGRCRYSTVSRNNRFVNEHQFLTESTLKSQQNLLYHTENSERSSLRKRPCAQALLQS